MHHKFYGIIAKNPTTIKNGLMYVKTPLKKDIGMLFDMGRLDNHTFWMKNTYIPLDLIFLNSNFRIIGLKADNNPLSLKKIGIDKNSRYILEVNAGSIKSKNIKIGDYIDFYTMYPPQ
jgi:uncharacterized membrane protein (UPF0127 family)